jgi:predicted dehydrogenase
VREPGPKFILHGTDGSFIKRGIDPQEEQLKRGITPVSEGYGIEDEKYWGKLNTGIRDLHFTGKVETLKGNYLSYYDNIAHAIRDGAELLVKPGQSLEVIRIIRAAIESNEKGIKIKL